MTFSSIVWFLIIGGLAGWLAGLLARGYGFGLVGNIFIGAIGALLGGTLFEALGVQPGDGFLWTLATAVIGALVLLFLAGLVKRLFRW